ncbi:MAG: signal peptide peptidase SppA [Spirochaetaceae bacterium]
MKFATLTLSGSFAETAPQTGSLRAAGRSKRFRFDTFLLSVEKILDNRRIRRVLIDCRPDFAPRLFGGAEAVREQLERLCRSGREIYFYAREYDQLRLYLASVCSIRIIHPLGHLSFFGVSRPFLFFKNLIDKHKIEPEILRRGEYKSAGDRFRTDSLDQANREQYRAYLDRVTGELEEQVERGFNKSKGDLREFVNGTILTAQAARQEGWIEEIDTLSRRLQEWKEEKAREEKLKKLGRSYGKGRKKIAVLVFEGAIIDGESRELPGIGQALGDSSYLPHIRKLAEDKSVKGVVFRVNSGGGSAIASEEILSALRELRKKKPLVVSMSELAGSGGYWIALEAERVFAHKTTLTGSIGVITMLFSLQKFLKRLGITTETIRTGPHADLGSGLRSMSKEERKIMQALVDDLYETFVEKVAKARGRTVEEVEAIARGRVWSGFDGVTRGLVDELGGLTDAVEYLRSSLNLKRSTVAFYPEVKRSFLQRLILKNAPVAVPAGLGETARLLSVLRGPLALMPEAVRPEELIG